MQLSNEQVLKVLGVAVRYLQEKIDPEMPAQRILTLVGVAQHPGAPQFELGEMIGLPAASTISRNLNDLTHLTSRRKPGPDLVAQEPDPHFRRRNLVRLTKRGEALIAAMTAEVNQALEKSHAASTKGGHAKAR